MKCFTRSHNNNNDDDKIEEEIREVRIGKQETRRKICFTWIQRHRCWRCSAFVFWRDGPTPSYNQYLIA